MVYRTRAQASPSEPARVDRHTLRRHTVGSVASVVGGLLALQVFAVLAYGACSITCARETAGAVPRCNVEARGWSAAPVAPFQLTGSALHVVESVSDDASSTWLGTPGGPLRAGVDARFARETVTAAIRFLESPQELRWQSGRSTAFLGIFAGGAGAVVAGVMAYALRPRRLLVDRDAHVVRVGARTFALEGVVAAKVAEVDASTLQAVVLHARGGSSCEVIRGRPEDADLAARAINVALAQRHSSTRTMPGELREIVRTQAIELDSSLGTFDTVDDAGRWAKVEELLQGLRIDGVEVVRSDTPRRIEARGMKRGVPIRVALDPLSPSQVVVASSVGWRRGTVEVHHRRGARGEGAPSSDAEGEEPGERRTFIAPGVFIEGGRAAAQFRALPDPVQKRVASDMRMLRIARLRIGKRETRAEHPGRIVDARDPRTRLAAIVDLVAAVADAASSPGR